MQRGEIRIVSFDLARGSEVQKTRPAVIMSNDGANSAAARLGRGVITVVPLTSNVTRVFPFHVLLPASETGLERDSKAQTEQIRAVAVERVTRHVGIVPPMRMMELDEALRLHLAL